MIIFLYGEDKYRSRQKLNEIVKHYKKIHKSGLNLKYFNAKDIDFHEFEDEMKQASMFKEKKLAILRNVFSDKDFREKFLKKGKEFSDSKNIILIYEENNIPKNNSLLLFLKKYSKSQEFNLLEGYRLRNWINKEFEKFGAKIENSALEKLIEFVGNDLWQMKNEIEKLSNYKKRGTIKEEDIELLVKPKIETDIFRTIDALASRDKKKALRLIRAHLEKGDSPLYLLSMIKFQFRNLLIIKDLIQKNLPPRKLTDLHPYVIQKSFFLSKRFEFSELKGIYKKIFWLDLKIKTGRIKPETALDLLVTEI